MSWLITYQQGGTQSFSRRIYTYAPRLFIGGLAKVYQVKLIFYEFVIFAEVCFSALFVLSLKIMQNTHTSLLIANLLHSFLRRMYFRLLISWWYFLRAISYAYISLFSFFPFLCGIDISPELSCLRVNVRRRTNSRRNLSVFSLW